VILFSERRLAMQVRVFDKTGELLWVKTETGGVTSLSHRQDGTLEKIIGALESALCQARAEAVQVNDDDHAMFASADDIDVLLNRDFSVDVRGNNVPDPGRFEERMPLGWSDEAHAVTAFPDCDCVPG
jgi:hypothetical protein